MVDDRLLLYKKLLINKSSMYVAFVGLDWTRFDVLPNTL